MNRRCWIIRATIPNDRVRYFQSLVSWTTDKDQATLFLSEQAAHETVVDAQRLIGREYETYEVVAVV